MFETVPVVFSDNSLVLSSLGRSSWCQRVPRHSLCRDWGTPEGRQSVLEIGIASQSSRFLSLVKTFFFLNSSKNGLAVFCPKWPLLFVLELVEDAVGQTVRVTGCTWWWR